MPTQINGFVVLGAIEAKWLATGAQAGYLGMPTSNETPTFDGVGRFQSFQHGRIAWHPQIGAFSVIGLICARWQAIGAEQFGYPITDESTCPDKHGRYNHFRTIQIGPTRSVRADCFDIKIKRVDGTKILWERWGHHAGVTRHLLFESR